MIKEIIMPKLGQTVEESTVGKWLKKEGDKVEKGDVLLEITTDKATLEVESFANGVLRKIVHKERDIVPVLAVIGYIASSMDEEIPEKPQEQLQEEKKEVSIEEPIQEVQDKSVIEEVRIKISPLAKKLAKEKGVDITKVNGTGPGGRIVKEDILAFGGKAEGREKIAAKIIPLSGIRKVIAKRLQESKQTIPHFYLSTEIDMTECVKARAEKSPKPAFNDIIIKASALAISENSEINSSFKGDSIEIIGDINIGLAVAVDDGLVVPVIRNADKLAISDISKKRDELVKKARGGKLLPSDYEGGTFTISNLGMFEIDNFSAIINPPQSAILAIGRIKQKPVVIDGNIGIRSMMQVTCSFDHRCIDGALGAKFLQKVKGYLEDPKNMFLI
ncbi:MAG: dihydrolipoamide acetyltransferase family protein [bacterium]|nr:dihydrolipoamide acetyltransferase family protein [bacterium]